MFKNIKELVKVMAVDMAIRSVYTAAEETVRVFVRKKAGTPATPKHLDVE